MQIRHNGPKDLTLTANGLVSMAFGEPYRNGRFSGPRAINLNSDDLVAATNNKPQAFRMVENTGHLEVPDYIGLDKLQDQNGFHYSDYDQLFPNGSVVRHKQGSVQLQNNADLIEFLAGPDEPKVMAVVHAPLPANIRVATVTVIPALKNRFKNGCIALTCTAGEVPVSAIYASFKTAESVGLDYATFTIALIDQKGGDTESKLLDVDTRYRQGHGHFIQQLIQLKTGAIQQRLPTDQRLSRRK